MQGRAGDLGEERKLIYNRVESSECVSQSRVTVKSERFVMRSHEKRKSVRGEREEPRMKSGSAEIVDNARIGSGEKQPTIRSRGELQ